MRIYAACLASYNAGTLHGEWIDATQGIDGIRDDIDKMLRASPYPNVRVDCPDCEVARRGYGVAEGASPKGHRPDIHCDTCASIGTVPSAEEFAIHDYDEVPSTFGEYPDLEKVAAYCEAVEEHGEGFKAWADYHGADVFNLSADDYHEALIGQFDSWEDVAADYVESTGMLDGVPENVRQYFDYEKYGRDLSFDGFEHDGWYFWSR